jgi:hypothetical protein
MCKTTITLPRALAIVRGLSAGAREQLRRHLNVAPEPPSMADAIRSRRAVASDTPEARNANLRAAITPAPVE